jgi:hypothetical protein
MKWALLLCCAPLLAHTVSLSTSELRISGAQAQLKLVMPEYEMAHVRGNLLDAIEIAGATRTAGSCTAQECSATYQFPAPPETVTVVCKLAQMTVPNHVHLMRATRDGRVSTAAFDITFDRAELAFEDHTRAREFVAGMVQAATSYTTLLIVLAIALSGPSWRLGALAFAAGAILSPNLLVRFAPSFLEIAMAVSVAYIAAESLLVPQVRTRAFAACLLGVAYGGMQPSTVASGAAVLIVMAVLVAHWLPYSRVLLGLTIAGALAWFARHL